MCLDRYITFDRCAKREIRHYICSKYIEHTRQLNQGPCPDSKMEDMCLERDNVCQCIADRQLCVRESWALPGDGIHSWKFEVEAGNDWAVKRGDKVAEPKAIEANNKGYAPAKHVEEIRGAKKAKYSNWDQEEEEYEADVRRRRDYDRAYGESSSGGRRRSERYSNRNDRHYDRGRGDYYRPDDSPEDHTPRIKKEPGTEEPLAVGYYADRTSEEMDEDEREAYNNFKIEPATEPIMKIKNEDDAEMDSYGV